MAQAVRKKSKSRCGLAITLLGFCLLSSWSALVARQNEQAPTPSNLAQLKAANEADLLLIFNEAAINKVAQTLLGLEFTLANGALLRLQSVATRLKVTGAEINFEVAAQASPTAKSFNLQLSGLLGNAELQAGVLRVPFKLTKIELANGLLTPLLRVWLGEWLTPERWNAALPKLAFPQEITQNIEIPATQFDVKGTMPMTVTTQPYQLPLNFLPSAFCLLDGRAIIGLRLESKEVTAPGAPEANEIAQLTEKLAASRELRARISRQLIGQLLNRLATAREDDIRLQLQPARVREEQTGGLLAVTNYTDMEGGSARADIRQLFIERIDENSIETRLQAQGVFDTKLRGREYGIPYRLAPHGTFSINDRAIPLRVAGETERIFLQATPGTFVPLDLRFQFALAGREVGFNRQINLPAEKLFNKLELPSFYLHQLPLPRKLLVDKNGKLNISEQHELNLQLSGLQLRAQGEAIDFTGDLNVKN